jgi:hypothetical protein
MVFSTISRFAETCWANAVELPPSPINKARAIADEPPACIKFFKSVSNRAAGGPVVAEHPHLEDLRR